MPTDVDIAVWWANSTQKANSEMAQNVKRVSFPHRNYPGDVVGNPYRSQRTRIEGETK